MGLNTGLLDADAAAAALILILNDGYKEDILDNYSDERRKVFQTFVDPTSTYNKLRLHSVDPKTATKDDWYLKLMARGPTQEEAMELMRPFVEVWRTGVEKLKGA
jgi:2-polyprenyl-6-methoxyphenol hydroxylase-like FAD-dependent oxidoreductase